MKPRAMATCDCRNWRKYIRLEDEERGGAENSVTMLCRIHGIVTKRYPKTEEQIKRQIERMRRNRK